MNEKRNDPIEIPLINNLPLPESSEDEEVEAIEKEGQSLMLSQGPKIITRATQDQMDEPDPWEYWDPHDDCGIVAKPFKKGNTHTRARTYIQHRHTRTQLVLTFVNSNILIHLTYRYRDYLFYS